MAYMGSQSSFWAKMKTEEREKEKWKVSLVAIREIAILKGEK